MEIAARKKQDKRPALLRAIYPDTRVASEIDITNIRREAVSISLQLGQKYLSLFSQDDLYRSAHIVLGLASLGLDESMTGGQKPTVVLQNKGFMSAFERGWRFIADIVKISNDEYLVNNLLPEADKMIPDVARNTRMELFDILATDAYSSDFEAPKQLFEIKEHLFMRLDRSKFRRFLHDLFEEPDHVPLLELVRFPTLFISLLISSKPRAPLTLADIKRIKKSIEEGVPYRTFLKRLQAFRNMVPENWHIFFDEECDHFMNREMPGMIKAVEEGNFDRDIEVRFSVDYFRRSRKRPIKKSKDA